MQRIAESLPPPRHKRSTDEVFSEPQRLHKVLASCGFGSRRAMEEMILAGRITVNRMPAEVGQKVGPGDEVRINGEVVTVRFTEPRPRMLMYHKPAGELVTRDDPEGRPTVFEKLPAIGSGRWINIGRLDYNTEGLLLFTNSGELANRLMHPRYEVEREYAVRVMGRLRDDQMQALTSGVQLEDGLARCESVSDAGGDDDGSNHWYHVVLKEGRNREVRRLFEALGLMVSRLIRTRHATLAMPKHLKRGELMELESDDVDRILASAGLRSAQARPQQSPGARGARHARKGKGGHPGGGRPMARPQKPKPHGPRVESRPVTGAAPPGRDGATAPSENSQSPHAFRHPGNPRRWKKRGGTARTHDGATQRPAQHDSARKPANPHGQGQRPPHARDNFDEVQPQSNANANPFARTTLTVPGAVTRGHGGGAGARHRSGPRAQKGNPNGQGRAGRESDRPAELLDRGQGAYNAPMRPTTHTQVRSKRPRRSFNGSVAIESGAGGADRPEAPPVKDDEH